MMPDIELGPDLDQKTRAMTEVADRDLEEVRVNFRWRQAQLDVVKRAAELLGVPYQTYIKQVVFRQALADIRATESIAGPPVVSRKRS